MPTLPPERPSEPHHARDLATSFGTDPERYDRARPRYPDALVDRIVAAAPGPDLLDVGIGTGIAARQFEAAGCRVTGVEIDPRMAEWTRRQGFDVEVASFESWNPAGRTFDTIISAQTWHWIDPHAGAAKAAEALRPGGVLAVFWNVDQPPPEVTAAFAEIYQRLAPGSLAALRWTVPSDGYSALCAKAADGILHTNAFTSPRQHRFTWHRRYTRAEWLDQLPTTGAHTRLDPTLLAEITSATAQALDALGGAFTMTYTTSLVTAHTV